MASLKLFKRVIFLGVAVGIYAFALKAVEFNPSYILKESHRFFRLLSEMYPPDFSGFHLLIRPLLQTIQMAVLGTFLGALMSLPLVTFGSQVVVKNPFVYWPVRSVMNLIRTVPDLLYAVIFVAAMGIGPIAGVPALAFFSCAIISKLTSESADNINKRPIEAVEAVGANKLQLINYAVMPQLSPAFVDHTIYVFELNIRVAAVIAYVGAGGIGSKLITALEWFKYDQALAVILTIFALVIVIDFISNRIRDAFIHGINLPTYLKVVFTAVFFSLLGWSFSSLEINPQRILEGMIYFKNLIWIMVTQPATDYFGLSVSWSYPWIHIENYKAVGRMIQSVEIAFVGTTISFLLAFPLGFLCSRKYAGMPEKLAILFKQIPNAVRAFPELILAIFFIASFGPGPLPGVLAIAIHSVGMLGKFNAEAVEMIRKEPVEALQASGAGRLQVFWYGILPQVLPEFLARGIYRFEINVRAASVLGIVGAGGIGSLISEAIGLRKWDLVGMCLIVIVVVVSIIDYISARIRKKLIEGF